MALTGLGRAQDAMTAAAIAQAIRAWVIAYIRDSLSGLSAGAMHAASAAQYRVLVPLCRPFMGGASAAVPATNPQSPRSSC